MRMRFTVPIAIALAFSALAPCSAQQTSKQAELSELFALIDRADEMVVYSEGFKREFVIFRSTHRKDFNELKTAISLKPRGGPSNCACIDGPEIALLSKNEEVAAVWNHEGTAIGSSVWQGEWENADPERWLHWFDSRGITSAREEFNEKREQLKNAAAAEKRWQRAMPSSIKPLWENALKQYDAIQGRYPEVQSMDSALQQQYPDTNKRIQALMNWYGSGTGPWSGTPPSEAIVVMLLKQYPTASLIQVARAKNLTPQELEGASRFLAGTPSIPEDVRQRLLEHCLGSSDRDEVEWAKRVFAAEK